MRVCGRGCASGCECDLALTFWHFPTHITCGGHSDKSIICSFLLQYSCLGLSPVCFAVLVSLFIWRNQVSDSHTVTCAHEGESLGASPTQNPRRYYQAGTIKPYSRRISELHSRLSWGSLLESINQTTEMKRSHLAVAELWPTCALDLINEAIKRRRRLLFIHFVWHSSPVTPL